MDELQARHRKEQRDLQSRITQKKKQASKKTRKGVNDECERLESELRERQRSELAALDGHSSEAPEQEDDETASADQVTDPTAQVDEANETPRAPSSTAALPPEASHSDKNDDDGGGGGGGATNPSTTTPASAASATTDPQSHPKPNRQKARLARRAAERASAAATAEAEAQTLPDLKSQERTRMLEAMSSRKLREVEVRADGHCLYSAFADQLSSLNMPLASSTGSAGVEGLAATTATPPLPYKVIRAAAAGYISSHPEDFVPFLEEPLEEYVAKVRDTGEWGGQVELLALAASYGVGINVLQDFGRVERIESGTAGEDAEKREIWLGYYKHGFGLGEHYNSLRRIA